MNCQWWLFELNFYFRLKIDHSFAKGNLISLVVEVKINEKCMCSASTIERLLENWITHRFTYYCISSLQIYTLLINEITMCYKCLQKKKGYTPFRPYKTRQKFQTQQLYICCVLRVLYINTKSVFYKTRFLFFVIVSTIRLTNDSN